MSESKEKRTLFILYILGIYILFQATWWAYHLIDMNAEVYRMKSIMLGVDHTPLLKTKIIMIIGEGSIFLLLLGLGFWQIKRNISKELRLARMEKTFLLSVTHELKTPIAAIKLFLETLKTRKLPEEQQSKIVSDALKEAKRLEGLSENILLATRLDQSKQVFQDENFDISMNIASCASRYKSLFPDREIKLDLQENLMFYGDPQLVQSMMTNLIENAIKYSTETSPVLIKTSGNQNMIQLEISDEGVGIPVEERHNIFNKFYRIGNENTRKSKGTGLGLYIVKNVVKLHSGSIDVSANHPKGTTFKITLPLLKK
ncbi:MAG: HAMP domain-containing sensor histidine kinase [Flavobacteriales bacterium]